MAVSPIILIEEQASLRDALSHILESRGKTVETQAELPAPDWQPEDGAIIVLDWGLTNLETVRTWLTALPKLRLIITALLIEKSEALALLRAGVWSVHRKPLNVRDFLEDLSEAEVQRPTIPSSRTSSASDAVAPAKSVMMGQWPVLPLLGSSESAEELRERLQPKVVASAPPWLAIHGPPGTRKDALARQWHAARYGGFGQFIHRHARGLSAEDWEREFVVEKSQPGELLRTEGEPRTVYLECVEALEEAQQQQLSRLLAHDDKQLYLILSLDGDLESLFDAGKLSSGLYSRMSLSTLETLPLLERLEDVPTMADALAEAPHDAYPSAKGLDEGALQLVQAYKWPGNFRELEHVILHGRLRADGGWIERTHLDALIG